MISDERKNQLLKYIGQNGYIEVERLAEKMFTSASTVRRNLTELERQGLVKRSYGKVSLSGEGSDVPLKLRYQSNHRAKQIIAAKASEYLKDYSVIFIDGSSTCLHLVPFLKQRQGLTVYTNGVELCTLLADSEVTVYSVGGILIPRSLAFAGEYAINMIRTLQCDALFFSCSGYADGLITDYSEPESHLRRELLRQSRTQYFLCDSSKLGKSFHYIVGRDTDVTAIITEDCPESL